MRFRAVSVAGEHTEGESGLRVRGRGADMVEWAK